MKDNFIILILLVVCSYGWSQNNRLPNQGERYLAPNTQETLLSLPVTTDDYDVTNEDTPVTTAVIDNDSSPDGNLDKTTVTVTTPPLNGNAIANTDGTVTYTPAPNYNGTDSYSYEVCEFEFDNLVFLATGNSEISTVALPNFGLSTAATLPTTINGLGYNPVDNKLYGMDDSDNDRVTQLYSINSSGNHQLLTNINPPPSGVFGSAIFWFVGDIAENGTYYFPAASINGIVPQDYTLYLGAIDLTAPIDPQNHTPTYTPINTAGGCQPYVDAYMQEIIDFYLGGGTGEIPSGGIQDWAFNPVDGLLYSYMGNEAAVFSLDITTGNTNCYATGNGSLTEFGAHFFDVAGDFYGVNSTTGNAYQISTNCPSATCGNLNFLTTITGDVGFDGASAPWTGFSPAICETATVFITVNPVKDPPVANNDFVTTVEDVPVTIDVLGNDSDPDGPLDPGNVAVGPPFNGTTLVNADGTITYTPTTNFFGQDSFFYQICDDTGLCSDARVIVTVTPAPLYDISGTIKSCAGDLLSQVTLSLNGASTSTTTSLNGDYDFIDVKTGNYSLTPTRPNTTTSDGLSVMDLIPIQQHIIGLVNLSDPCDLIAADVNGSCGLSVIDIILIKQIILGTITDFPSGDVWRFYPENHNFPTGVFPCAYPQAIDFSPLSQNETNQNFIGIKLGDVNRSAAP